MISRRSSLGMLASTSLLAARPAYAAFENLTVFEAKRFITMEPSRPACRFIAVSDGIVVALGDSLAELEPWTRGRTVSIDRRLAGKIVMPGLIDPHLHPMQASVMLNIPFIAPDPWNLPAGQSPSALTPQAYRQRLAEALAKSADSPFITWGYHELFHGPLSRADLDAMAPGRAIAVWQRSFHDIIVSTPLLQSWGADSEAGFAALLQAVKADPAHGDFKRGLFTETGLLAALAKLRPVIMTPGKIRKGMADLQTILRRSGVTTVSDMGTGVFADFETEAGLIRGAFERSDSAARVMLMPMAAGLDAVTDLDAWLRNAARFTGTHIRLDRRVKMLADGAFFALNMRMNAPGYLDGHQGRWITEPDKLHAQFKRYWDAAFSLHIHVNGDEGLDVVLDGLGALPPRSRQTITLEHLGYSTEAQNRRIAAMGLMVSAQPNYIRVLGDVYGREGLGPGRAEAINRLGSLERKGVPLGLHSDFNMAPIDPLYLAWVAATRETVEGKVKSPSERLTLDKALRAITIEAAQVIGMDAMVGSLAPGKKADLAVLDKDPYAVGTAGLRAIAVEAVAFEGQLTFN
jgi:predicted amidohydrolase YtcJ